MSVHGTGHVLESWGASQAHVPYKRLLLAEQLCFASRFYRENNSGVLSSSLCCWEGLILIREGLVVP